MALPLKTIIKGMQARTDRHNQGKTAAERGSQSNQDWDHYLVGNEMAGPQYPLWQRLGAAVPAALHEVVRPLLANSTMATDVANKIMNPSGDQPPWIATGAGAGGAAAEAPVSVGGAIHNLATLYRGATEGSTPDQVKPNVQGLDDWIAQLMIRK